MGVGDGAGPGAGAGEAGGGAGAGLAGYSAVLRRRRGDAMALRTALLALGIQLRGLGIEGCDCGLVIRMGRVRVVDRRRVLMAELGGPGGSG